DRLQVAVHARVEGPGTRRLPLQHLPEGGQGRFAAERGAAGEQLVEDRTEAVHVGRDAYGRGAGGLLRGHVTGRPDRGPGLGQARGGDAPGQAEVGDVGSKGTTKY